MIWGVPYSPLSHLDVFQESWPASTWGVTSGSQLPASPWAPSQLLASRKFPSVAISWRKGEKTPGRRGDWPLCSESAPTVTNLLHIPILLLTLSQLENSSLVGLDDCPFIPPAWECKEKGY